jgi:hypothetical protein
MQQNFARRERSREKMLDVNLDACGPEVEQTYSFQMVEAFEKREQRDS